MFTTTGLFGDGEPCNSAAFTTLDGVDIGLADVSDAVGIQIGGKQILNNPSSGNDSDTTVPFGGSECPVFVDAYSSHLRAVVRLGNLGGCGLKVINGYLHFVQAHLTVIGHNNVSDVGIDLQEAHGYKDYLVTNSYNYPPAGIFGAFVFYSQFSQIDNSNTLTSPGGFMLVTSNVSSQNRIRRHSADLTEIDIDVKSLT